MVQLFCVLDFIMATSTQMGGAVLKDELTAKTDVSKQTMHDDPSGNK